MATSRIDSWFEKRAPGHGALAGWVLTLVFCIVGCFGLIALGIKETQRSVLAITTSGLLLFVTAPRIYSRVEHRYRYHALSVLAVLTLLAGAIVFFVTGKAYEEPRITQARTSPPTPRVLLVGENGDLVFANQDSFDIELWGIGINREDAVVAAKPLVIKAGQDMPIGDRIAPWFESHTGDAHIPLDLLIRMGGERFKVQTVLIVTSRNVSIKMNGIKSEW